MPHFICDVKTKLVMGISPSISTANIVSSGLAGTNVISLHSAYVRFLSGELKVNVREDLFSIGRWNQFEKMSKSKVGKDLLSRKKLAELRCIYVRKIELLCRGMFRAKVRFNWPFFNQYLAYEMGKCRPKQKKFSIAVREYAEISGIAYDVAFQELRMHLDSDSSFALRTFAYFQKFSQMVNQEVALDEMEAVLLAAQKEMIRNASI